LQKASEGDDIEVLIDDDGATEQLPVQVPPDTPVDDQPARAVPVVEDVVPEPTPADIIEVVPEEPTTVEVSEASKPSPEATAQMDVEESVVPQEPEPEPESKVDGKSQQREGMHLS
jgi:hypothetical protein